MQSKTSLKRSLFFVGIVEIALSLMIIFSLTLGFPVQISYAKLSSTTSQTSSTTLIKYINPIALGKKLDLGIPVRLKIPKINVDASIIDVGLTPDGAMDVPKGPYEVAWYNLGPRPGQQGSAVIDGHYGKWKNGAVSVFQNLQKLRKGDKVSVWDDKGNSFSFVVTKSKMYAPTDNASEVFTSTDGKSHLNLITCVWDKASQSYSKRLVIFTDKG